MREVIVIIGLIVVLGMGLENDLAIPTSLVEGDFKLI